MEREYAIWRIEIHAEFFLIRLAHLSIVSFDVYEMFHVIVRAAFRKYHMHDLVVFVDKNVVHYYLCKCLL